MTEIVVATSAPFAVELMVFEEDTWLLMSASNVVREVRESSAELQADAEAQSRLEPGDILKRGNRWYAVVNDIDDDSFEKEQVVEQALVSLFAEVESHGITSFGIEAFRGCADLADQLRLLAPQTVEHIWIKE